MKILGIDFGKKRIGLAISDLNTRLSIPFDTLEAKKSLKETAQYLAEKLSDRLESIDSIIIGLPLHLDGSESDMCKICREFGRLIEKKLLKKVFFVDERFSTLQVDNDFKRLGIKRKNRGKHLNAASASIILQSYLDRL